MEYHTIGTRTNCEIAVCNKAKGRHKEQFSLFCSELMFYHLRLSVFKMQCNGYTIFTDFN